MIVENLKLHKHLNKVWQYFAKDNWDLIPVYQITHSMYLVFFYRNQLERANTPETESLARWSLNDAKSNLVAKMHQYGLPEDIKKSIKLYCDIL